MVGNDRHIADDLNRHSLMERPFIAQARIVEDDLESVEAALGLVAQDVSLDTLDGDLDAAHGSCHMLSGSQAITGYMSFGQPTVAQGWHRDWFGLVMPLSGRARVEQYPLGHVSVQGPIFVLPASEQHWQFSRGCEVLFFHFHPPSDAVDHLRSLYCDAGKGAEFAPVEQLRAFMERLPARLHLGLPKPELKRRLQLLQAELLGLFGVAEAEKELESLGQWPLDRRVERVAQRLKVLERAEFDLSELTDLAHMSQRGLYYAFKRNFGCSLYQYFKACQLVRVRIALLKDRERNHSIACHASREGFQHMSRLSAQYRRHFGEKPSETLARLAR